MVSVPTRLTFIEKGYLPTFITDETESQKGPRDMTT